MRNLFVFMLLSVMVLLEPVNAKDLKVGLTVTPWGENDVFRFILVEGSGSCSGDGFYIVGVTCQIPMTSRLDMETGFVYNFSK